MKILNIHEREIPVPAATAGVLLNSLASESDGFWPGTTWPRMRLTGPLRVGATGGHGPVRYAVEAFGPGRLVKFRFMAPSGFEGGHFFEVLPAGGRGALLRHTLDMSVTGLAALSWLLVYRPLHDALLEDALALAQLSLGKVPQIRPWSLWVRALRWLLSGGTAPRQWAPVPIRQGFRQRKPA
ncbi:MAG: hypothetical protein PHU46_12575 [Rhodocyclaceae bacterium]|nr:hypothetical protein [Rhodocyclaceae bacterium]